MLKEWAKFAGFSALLAVALAGGLTWALPNLFPPNPSERSITECQFSGQQHPTPGGNIYSTHNSIPAIPPSESTPRENTSQQTNQKLDRKYECLLAAYTGQVAWFTELLAFVTTVLIIVGIYQGSQLKDSVELARSEFIASHRPLLRLKHIWFATPDGQRFFGHIQTGIPITVRLDIVNIGNTIAFVRSINFMTYLVPLGQRLPQRPPYNEPGVPKVAVYDFAVESGRTLTLPITVGQILSPENVETVRSGQGRLYFIGTIEYWWGSDRDHLRQTAFCRYLKFEYPSRADDTGRFQKEEDPDYEYQD